MKLDCTVQCSLRSTKYVNLEMLRSTQIFKKTNWEFLVQMVQVYKSSYM